jgi:hypothetical protein
VPTRLLRILTGFVATVPRASPRPRWRPPDRQRARVYRWEQAVVFPGREDLLDLAACRMLVEAAYRWAEADCAAAPGWAPPRVTDGRGRRHACGSREVVKLPRWARTAPIVLHECAHGLAPDQHGPCFVAAYVALLERFLGMDGAALRASLAAAGIACGEARYGPAGRLELRAAQAGCSPTKVMKRSTRPSAPKAKTS